MIFCRQSKRWLVVIAKQCPPSKNLSDSSPWWLPCEDEFTTTIKGFIKSIASIMLPAPQWLMIRWAFCISPWRSAWNRNGRYRMRRLSQMSWRLSGIEPLPNCKTSNCFCPATHGQTPSGMPIKAVTCITDSTKSDKNQVQKVASVGSDKEFPSWAPPLRLRFLHKPRAQLYRWWGTEVTST